MPREQPYLLIYAAALQEQKLVQAASHPAEISRADSQWKFIHSRAVLGGSEFSAAGKEAHKKAIVHCLTFGIKIRSDLE